MASLMFLCVFVGLAPFQIQSPVSYFLNLYLNFRFKSQPFLEFFTKKILFPQIADVRFKYLHIAQTLQMGQCILLPLQFSKFYKACEGLKAGDALYSEFSIFKLV